MLCIMYELSQGDDMRAATATTAAFQQAAQRQDPAVFDYALEVGQVWRDFPETKDSVFFVDLCAGISSKGMVSDLVYPRYPERKKVILQWVNNQDDILSTIAKYQTKVKNSCYIPRENNKRGFVLLYTQKLSSSFLEETSQLGQETAFVFDHELGHAIIPGGAGRDRLLRECIADAYAMIRHFQRYGADSPVIERIVESRALPYIFEKSGWGNFTSPVTAQILARRYDIQWDSLTPEETKQLAQRFAHEYVMPAERLKALDLAFKKVRKAFKGGFSAQFQELAEEVLSTGSPDVFKWGVMVLKIALDSRLEGIVLTGDYWDNVRRNLAEKQKIFEARDELLFGFGGEDLPLQRRTAVKKRHKISALSL